MNNKIFFVPLVILVLTACGTQAPVATATTVPPVATLVPPTATMIPTVTATATMPPSPTPQPVVIDTGSRDKVFHVVQGQPVFIEGGFVFDSDLRNKFVDNTVVHVTIDNDKPLMITDQSLWSLTQDLTQPKYKYSIEWKWQVPNLTAGSHMVTLTFYYIGRPAGQSSTVTIIVGP